MGGRGSAGIGASKIKQTTVPTVLEKKSRFSKPAQLQNEPSKATKQSKNFVQERVEAIKKLTNVDLRKYEVTQFGTHRNRINIDWKGMSRKDQQNLSQFLTRKSSNAQMVDGGAWMKTIFFKKKS